MYQSTPDHKAVRLYIINAFFRGAEVDDLLTFITFLIFSLWFYIMTFFRKSILMLEQCIWFKLGAITCFPIFCYYLKSTQVLRIPETVQTNLSFTERFKLRFDPVVNSVRIVLVQHHF